MILQCQEALASAMEPVLVVIPCLNEEQHLEQLVTNLLTEVERIDMKIVVADGGSTDRSRSIASRLARRDSRVVLMDNPDRIQAAAVNRAVREFGRGARYLIRIDAHASYPKDYCEQLIKVQARTCADSVVVTMKTKGDTCFERAAAAAQNSVLGNGRSAHRNQGAGGWVDHGHHALMTIEAFDAIGGYNDRFAHNEDVELDLRLIASGYHIYMADQISITYYPRGSLKALLRQYAKFGYGRARTFMEHRNMKFRHLVLAGVAPTISLLVLTPISLVFAVPALTWAWLCFGFGIVLGLRLRDLCASAAGIPAMAMQAGWSFGFYAGLVDVFLEKYSLKPDMQSGFISSGSRAKN